LLWFQSEEVTDLRHRDESELAKECGLRTYL
jgi:hypothetical protein